MTRNPNRRLLRLSDFDGTPPPDDHTGPVFSCDQYGNWYIDGHPYTGPTIVLACDEDGNWTASSTARPES